MDLGTNDLKILENQEIMYFVKEEAESFVRLFKCPDVMYVLLRLYFCKFLSYVRLNQICQVIYLTAPTVNAQCTAESRSPRHRLPNRFGSVSARRYTNQLSLYKKQGESVTASLV